MAGREFNSAYPTQVCGPTFQRKRAAPPGLTWGYGRCGSAYFPIRQGGVHCGENLARADEKGRALGAGRTRPGAPSRCRLQSGGQALRCENLAHNRRRSQKKPRPLATVGGGTAGHENAALLRQHITRERRSTEKGRTPAVTKGHGQKSQAHQVPPEKARGLQYESIARARRHERKRPHPGGSRRRHGRERQPQRNAHFRSGLGTPLLKDSTPRDARTEVAVP
jgi:hypothetical protein